MINTNSSGGELALLLTQTNGGTRISSTRYVHYGKIAARSEWVLGICILEASHVPDNTQSKLATGVVLLQPSSLCRTSRMRLIGSSPEPIPLKARRTTSGKASFVCSLIPWLASCTNCCSLAATKTNGGTSTGLTDTFSNYHEYAVSFIETSNGLC